MLQVSLQRSSVQSVLSILPLESVAEHAIVTPSSVSFVSASADRFGLYGCENASPDKLSSWRRESLPGDGPLMSRFFFRRKYILKSYPSFSVGQINSSGRTAPAGVHDAVPLRNTRGDPPGVSGQAPCNLRPFGSRNAGFAVHSGKLSVLDANRPGDLDDENESFGAEEVQKEQRSPASGKITGVFPK